MSDEHHDAQGEREDGDGSSHRGYLDRLLVQLQWLQVRFTPTFRRINWTAVRGIGLTATLSFVLASIVSTSSADILFRTAEKMQKLANMRRSQLVDESGRGSSLGSVIPSAGSTSEIRNAILERNLFNSEGKLAPDDASNNSITVGERDRSAEFEQQPCINEKIPVQILGVIVRRDSRESLVAMKDAKVDTADIYRIGDNVIDHEDYSVHAIKRDVIEIRKGDVKICVSPEGSPKSAAGVSGSSPGADSIKSESILLSAGDMSQLVGDGAAIAHQAAKLIPDGEVGSREVRGFRLLAIKPGSIFDRLKLKNRDVLVEVNGESLRDPTKGFKVYEVLDREREITIHFERNGERMTRKVTVQ